jgi:hypothetical protein
MEAKPTLVVNKKTRVLYKYLGDDTYENIQTKLVGKLKPDDAKKYFSIPLRLNSMIDSNPSLLLLIEQGLFDYFLEKEGSISEPIFYAQKKINYDTN